MKENLAMRASSALVPVFRVSAQGVATLVGHIHPLQNGFYVLASNESDNRRFQGMPFFLCDVWPQGFMGRMEPGKYRDLGLPADIRCWTDEQACTLFPGQSVLHAIPRWLIKPCKASPRVRQSAANSQNSPPSSQGAMLRR